MQTNFNIDFYVRLNTILSNELLIDLTHKVSIEIQMMGFGLLFMENPVDLNPWSEVYTARKYLINSTDPKEIAKQIIELSAETNIIYLYTIQCIDTDDDSVIARFGISSKEVDALNQKNKELENR